MKRSEGAKNFGPLKKLLRSATGSHPGLVFWSTFDPSMIHYASGWKGIQIRRRNSFSNYVISPEGKRFHNLEDAHDYMVKKKYKEVTIQRNGEEAKQIFEIELSMGYIEKVYITF